MTITVEEVRKAYPNPVAFSGPVSPGSTLARNPEFYCVGKALCLFLDQVETDGTFDIIHALRTVNPQLSISEAMHIYRKVARENDAGNFDVAWAWLDKGLSA